MDLTSKSVIKDLLQARNLQPSKGLGQNFLIDRGAVRQIVEATDIQPNDTVLEIGPGLGVLTQELARRAKKVIAIEKDPNMVEILKKSIGETYGNVEIIRDDIRKSDFLKTPGVDAETPGVKTRKSDFLRYKVVGNLPFYLTAPVIRRFLENTRVQPVYLLLVVQKEVAQRICSKPPRMNLLAVSVQFYAEPKIISYIPRNSFWPSPEVDAAIIKIIPVNPEFPKPRQTPGVDGETPGVKSVSEIFFKIVKAGFSQPRKQLINNLSASLKINKNKIGEWLLANNIQPTQRAETLSIEDWIKMTKSFKMK
ncbi:MAG: ribosomal RNA small subunit methyltransferase A [Candidatus Nealsonbacteria bacterium]|nr:ribosomal RNA small subunit methyltransferase A [Candidatus Nealsonbacteria bacterium]